MILVNKTRVAIAAGVLLLTAIPVASVATSASAGTKPTYTVGFEGPLSGSLISLGQAAEYGVMLAVTQANASGTMPFTLNPVMSGNGTLYDDQCDGTLSPTQAQAAVADSSLIGIVGPECSGATRAAEPYYSSAKIATVSPSATAAALATGITNNNFMRVVPGDDVQGAADADYVVKTKAATKVVVLNDASFYGAGLAGVFAAQAKTDGATVVTATLPTSSACGGTQSTSQFASEATAIKSSGATAVFYGGYYCDFGQVLNALHNASYKGIVMSGDGSEDPSLLSSVTQPSYASGAYLSIAGGGDSALPSAFINAYNAQKGAPSAATAPYASQAYDAAKMIIAAMVSSYKAGITKAAFRSAVVTALHQATYTGLTGVIHFQSNGDLSRSSTINFYQVKSGQSGTSSKGGYGIVLIGHS